MKSKNIKIGIVAALGGLVAVPNCEVQTGDSNNSGILNADSLKLEKRLRELSQTNYTGELAWGAMCYDIAMPSYMDYTCPYCHDTIKEKYNSWTIYNINQVEEIVKQIKDLGYDVILDKTEFCPICSKKNIENPELIFKFRFSPNANYHVVLSNIVNEYQCLLAFLSNQDKYSGFYGEEHALHDNITIIQKMTGLGKDLKI
jgi:hypothetical protein